MESQLENKKQDNGMVQVSASRQLPEPRDGVAGRIIGQTKALSQDISSLIELRLKKAQIDIEERLENKINTISADLIFAVLGGVAGLFILVAISLALGDLLGHAAWGFLVTGVVLAVTGFIIKKVRPNLVNIGDKTAVVKEENLSAGAPRGRVLQKSNNR